MRELTTNEKAVIEFLRGRDFTSPTQIGYKLHPSRDFGSPWASPICKRLVSFGYLERNQRGQYRLALPDKEEK